MVRRDRPPNRHSQAMIEAPSGTTHWFLLASIWPDVRKHYAGVGYWSRSGLAVAENLAGNWFYLGVC